MIPKFRVALKNKIFSEVWSIDFVDETVTTPIYNKLDGEYLGEGVYELNQVILMQSTGLFDTNGVEIFEGDVVTSTWFKDYDDLVGYRKLGKVVYKNGYFCIEYPEDTEKDYPNTILDFAINVEIIGNIYENKEPGYDS